MCVKKVKFRLFDFQILDRSIKMRQASTLELLHEVAKLLEPKDLAVLLRTNHRLNYCLEKQLYE
jgi:hypothetical protein